MARALRPLSLGKLLDEAFDIYRHNFLLFLAISAIPNIALLLFELEWAKLKLTGTSSSTMAGILAFLGDYSVSLFVGSIVTAATTVAVSEVYLDRSISVWDCYSRISRKALKIVYISFALQLIIGLGMLICLLPGIMWAGIYGLAVPVVVLEDIRASRALGRSEELTAHGVGRVIVIFFLTSIFSAIMVGALNAAASAAGLTAPHNGILTAEMIQQINGTLGSILFGPISAIALTLEYYDQRVRKEAFDIDHMLRLIQPENLSTGAATL